MKCSVNGFSCFWGQIILSYSLLQQFQICVDGIFYLAHEDILVGRMRTCRLARPQLERGEGHEGLVAERGRPKGRHAQRNAALHQRVLKVDA